MLNQQVTMLSLILLSTVVVSSSVGSQMSLAVTVYNNDFALIKDTRFIQFDQGKSTLSFTDVSSNIEPETVTFKSLMQQESIRVYEQNFQTNLIGGQSILSRYIDKEIEVFLKLGNESKRVKGILLGVKDGLTLQTELGINFFSRVDAYAFPALPDGFFTLPTLNWQVHSKDAIETTCEIGYRTSGFSWKSDYTMIWSQNESQASFGGWVTITNRSGKKYFKAKLKLIAGKINLVRNNRELLMLERVKRGSARMADSSATSFREKSFSDYHMYTLSSLITLNDNSLTQVEFVPKIYSLKVHQFNFFRVALDGEGMPNIKAESKLQFNNSASNGLGIPLPKGTVRVFKADESDNTLEFVGEDSIDHTPKNQNITLTTGKAFDVVANKVAESIEHRKQGYQSKMKLIITNHKAIEAQVVVEFYTYHGDNNKITWLDSDYPLEKVSSTLYRVNRLFSPGEVHIFTWEEDFQI